VNVVKLGKKGQVSIPKALHLEGEQWLIVDTTEDGAIVLRPAGVAPIELYDDARIAAFLEEDELTPELAARVETALAAGAAEGRCGCSSTPTCSSALR